MKMRPAVTRTWATRVFLRANPIIREQVEAALRAGQVDLRFVQCDDGNPYTTAVGRHQPNALGLYDTIGNVWEYVEDCWCSV